jgi:hypothetical protein
MVEALVWSPARLGIDTLPANGGRIFESRPRVNFTAIFVAPCRHPPTHPACGFLFDMTMCQAHHIGSPTHVTTSTAAAESQKEVMMTPCIEQGSPSTQKSSGILMCCPLGERCKLQPNPCTDQRKYRFPSYLAYERGVGCVQRPCI